MSLEEAAEFLRREGHAFLGGEALSILEEFIAIVLATQKEKPNV